MSPSRIRTPLIILGFGVFALLSILLKNELRKETSPLAQFPIGQAMPDFTLRDLQGKEFTLSQVESQHKVIMVNFWASWCPPCRLEMPDFEKMSKQYGPKGLLIVGIAEDSEPDKLAAYLKQKPVSFPILADPGGALGKKFKIDALPTTILVSGKGKILSVVEGMDPYMGFRMQAELKPGKDEAATEMDGGSVSVSFSRGTKPDEKK